jgi:hypothetical protein
MGEDPGVRDASPSTGLRAGFDTLLRCAPQLPFGKLRAWLRMLP